MSPSVTHFELPVPPHYPCFPSDPLKFLFCSAGLGIFSSSFAASTWLLTASSSPRRLGSKVSQCHHCPHGHLHGPFLLPFATISPASLLPRDFTSWLFRSHPRWSPRAFVFQFSGSAIQSVFAEHLVWVELDSRCQGFGGEPLRGRGRGQNMQTQGRDTRRCGGNGRRG